MVSNNLSDSANVVIDPSVPYWLMNGEDCNAAWFELVNQTNNAVFVVPLCIWHSVRCLSFFIWFYESFEPICMFGGFWSQTQE